MSKKISNDLLPVKEKQKLLNYMALPRSALDMGLSDSAIILYALLLDRAKLSSNKGSEWIDENGDAFVRYTIEHLSETMHKGTSAVKTALKQLEEKHLIRRVHQGIGKANLIYVMVPADCIPTTAQSENRPPCIPTTAQSENRPPRSRNSTHDAVGNPSTNKITSIKGYQSNHLNNYYEDKENLSL